MVFILVFVDFHTKNKNFSFISILKHLRIEGKRHMFKSARHMFKSARHMFKSAKHMFKSANGVVSYHLFNVGKSLDWVNTIPIKTQDVSMVGLGPRLSSISTDSIPSLKWI